MRRLLRRVLPPRQTSQCAGCRRVIAERHRRPCPACGSINRHVSVSAQDALELTDRAD